MDRRVTVAVSAERTREACRTKHSSVLNTDSLLRSGSASLRVLLIEDDPAWQHLVSVGLGERGIDVQVTDSLSKALAIIARTTTDAILVDDGLPDADGFQAVAQLRE